MAIQGTLTVDSTVITGNLSITAGPPGVGVPPGGATGQVLSKASPDDYDTEWVNASGGIGGAVDSVNGQTGIVVLDTDDIAEGVVNQYHTDARVSANTDVATNTTHRGLADNPHGVTSGQIGLGNVDNTSDVDKPVSTAQQAALDAKADVAHTHLSSEITNFDTEVSNNPSVSANTSKVSADGPVTTHSDVTSAGSGVIISAAERTKLNGIEANATADQTGAEIKAAYEAEANTNAFTDVEKANLAAQSGTNTGDETTVSIQTKRPLKTINGETLEGVGNITVSGGGGGDGFTSVSIVDDIVSINDNNSIDVANVIPEWEIIIPNGKSLLFEGVIWVDSTFTADARIRFSSLFNNPSVTYRVGEDEPGTFTKNLPFSSNTVKAFVFRGKTGQNTFANNTLRAAFCQATATADPTTLVKGSYIKYKEI